MAEFKKHDLYQIYDDLLPKFVELAKHSSEGNVYFSLVVSPYGDITFNSTEYFTEKGKKYQRRHEIRQSKTCVSENSETKRI